MVTLKRMQEIRRILSKALYNKKYKELTERQSLIIAKKVKRVIKKESKK